MENDEGKLSDEHKLLELYKELGSDVRHFDRHIYIVNFQMVPALVIGLLVLYGGIKKFVGVEFANPKAVYTIVWIGCFLISLMWIIAVSRFAQVYHIHAKTRQQCERKLKLNAHQRIPQLDKKSKFSKWTRHYILRLAGFGMYFFLLLISPFGWFYENLIDWFVCKYYLWGLSIIISAIPTLCVWWRYFPKKKLEADYGSPLLSASNNGQ